ncbi:ring-cleaving dioxygenase [Alkalihalobacillus sp. AL-G]|uniref:ring-cleaving dioxygenase n=1 Tax=Alkalihalobacillus sp. AL-G TaxID=2926399 RepID=UPI00272C9797|nr:ring-cleaving dioxygenase [Alkalihalobacillus sp. AL-G]WLD94720.1 ring-cleaving dioxygenase [Alkalihalobacillus sp. AL-G]
MQLKGIHHVSALTAKAQKNLDFYTDTLGMRLVKKTVNQDDTSVYHLFYGDEKGNPGTELTFFEIPMIAQNHEGTNSISTTSLRVPHDEALSYWKKRFEEREVPHDEIIERAGRATIAFKDFEGQRLMLVSDENNEGVAPGIAWDKSPIPREYGIQGLGPIFLTVHNLAPTVSVLTVLLGFEKAGSYPSPVSDEPDFLVYKTGEGGTGAEVHIQERNDIPPERQGKGGVHHVAFRVEDEDELHEWISRIHEARVPNSGFVERFYFKSLYFREPNGILFELATDGPGFDTDEDIDHLGESLALPPFLEDQRESIEARLKPISLKKK